MLPSLIFYDEVIYYECGSDGTHRVFKHDGDVQEIEVSLLWKAIIEEFVGNCCR